MGPRNLSEYAKPDDPSVVENIK